MVITNQNLESIYKGNIKQVYIHAAEIMQTKGNRLESSVYCTEGRAARNKLINSSLKIENLDLSGSFVKNCYYPGRFKRIYVNKSTDGSYGFLGSAEMLDINPHPVKFLLPDANDLELLKVRYGDILVSRSGTIGNVTFVNETQSKYLRK